jgi:hypothetical protein
MAQFRPEHFSGTVRTTKDDLRFGPLKERRVNASPPDTYGRNGDFVIIDDTATSDEQLAITRVPVVAQFCQKIPFIVSGGTFTISATSGVYTITIATMDDFVDQVNRAQIPELRVEFTDPKTPSGGQNFLLHANSVTFSDGTSDLPSALGITGLQVGEVIVALGSWECFTSGSGQIDVADDGTAVIGTPFSELNFAGTAITSIVDSGSGRVTITIDDTIGGGGINYGSIAGDTGTAIATTSSELITFGGIGVTVVATNAGAGLDTISFNMDIADLPNGAGSPALGDTIAINIGGTTEEYPISALSALFLGTAYSSIAGGDGGTAVAIGSDLITVNGTGINVRAINAGAGLDTLNLILDIADLPDGAGPLIPGDELGVDDGGTTVRHTIEEVVDAVLPGVDITIINGQPMLTLIDTTRANKILSVAESNITFSENKVNHNDWIQIGNANDADSGYIAEFDGTLVYASAHCENTGGNTKEIHFYIGAADSATLGSLTGGANATFNNVTLNTDFVQGDRLRVRAHDGAGGDIQDTVVKLTLKWRS